MTDLEKPKAKPRAKKKPPTQTAGVQGFEAHAAMASAPAEPHINWQKLTGLPAFEMFVFEQTGLGVSVDATNWVAQRRATLSDSVLYDQYAAWHKDKGQWVGETPMGEVLDG